MGRVARRWPIHAPFFVWVPTQSTAPGVPSCGLLSSSLKMEAPPEPHLLILFLFPTMPT